MVIEIEKTYSAVVTNEKNKRAKGRYVDFKGIKYKLTFKNGFLRAQ